MSVSRFCVCKVVTARPDESALAAAQRMAQEQVGTLVIVDEGKVVGLMSDRDLAVRLLAAGLDPERTEVRAIMSGQPVCVRDDAPLEAAVDQMRFHRVRRLIVVDRKQALVGVISLDDLLELWGEEHRAIQAMAELLRASRHQRLVPAGRIA